MLAAAGLILTSVLLPATRLVLPGLVLAAATVVLPGLLLAPATHVLSVATFRARLTRRGISAVPLNVLAAPA